MSSGNWDKCLQGWEDEEVAGETEDAGAAGGGITTDGKSEAEFCDALKTAAELIYTTV